MVVARSTGNKVIKVEWQKVAGMPMALIKVRAEGAGEHGIVKIGCRCTMGDQMGDKVRLKTLLQ